MGVFFSTFCSYIFFFFLKLNGVRKEERHIRSGAINTDHEMEMTMVLGGRQKSRLCSCDGEEMIRGEDVVM